MARLNIEDCWWTDPRRDRLIQLVGGKPALADGVATRIWRLAQEFWKHGRNLIPISLFESAEESQKFMDAGLAELRDGFVYVRGSSAYLDWIQEAREKGSAGGKKSAQRPRDAKGRLLSSKQSPSRIQAESKPIQASSSASSSFSVSNSKNEESKGIDASRQPTSTDVSSVSPVPRFIGTYVKAYQAKYGEKTRPALGGKVQGQIKRFLQDTPIDRACDLIQVFLQMEDPWFITKTHDFATFAENQNKISLALDTGVHAGRSHIDWTKVFDEEAAS